MLDAVYRPRWKRTGWVLTGILQYPRPVLNTQAAKMVQQVKNEKLLRSYTLDLFIQVGAEIQLPVLEVPAMIRPKHFGSLRGWSQKIGWTWEGSWHGWLVAIWYWLVQLIILGGTFKYLEDKESKARLKELSTLWLHSKHSSVYMLWRNP